MRERIPGRKVSAVPAPAPKPLTAQQAAEIAGRPDELRPEIVESVFNCYMVTIRKAAVERRTSITHTEPDRLRCPVSTGETEAVHQRLAQLGYTVTDEGVSWS